MREVPQRLDEVIGCLEAKSSEEICHATNRRTCSKNGNKPLHQALCVSLMLHALEMKLQQ